MFLILLLIYSQLYPLVPGTIELYRVDYETRRYYLHLIEKYFKLYGFVGLEMPALYPEEVFKGFHGEGEKLLFHLEDATKQKLVLRYDLTVPFVNFVSRHPEIPRPIRRYQIQLSYRDDNVDKGHFREFYQCDADIIGEKNIVDDSQFIELACDVLNEIGFKNYIIRINHRGFLEMISKMLGCDQQLLQRTFDQIDKNHKGMIWTNLIQQDIFSKVSHHEVLEQFLNLEKYDINEALVLLKSLCVPEYDYVYEEFERIVHNISKESLSKCRFDITLARGADYYTGFIFEGVIPDSNVGAVLGGGRYDKMLHEMNENMQDSGVGFAFGLDRLLVAMEELNILKKQDHEIICIEVNEDYKMPDAISLAKTMRSEGKCVVIGKYNPNIHSNKIEI